MIRQLYIYMYIYVYDSESTQEELEDLFEGVQLAKEFVEKSSNRYILSIKREEQYWKGLIQ